MLPGDHYFPRNLPRLRSGSPLSRSVSIRSAGALVLGNANVLDHAPPPARPSRSAVAGAPSSLRSVPYGRYDGYDARASVGARGARPSPFG